jgi:hypothetical protein
MSQGLAGARPSMIDRSAEIFVPSYGIHRIQEVHAALVHVLWDLIHLALGAEDVI